MKILTLDIGGTAIKAGLMKEDASLVSCEEFPSNAAQGAAKLMGCVCEAVRLFHGFEKISVCITGQVDPRRGVVLFANENVPGLTGTDVRGLLAERFRVPVFVENDVNAAALGEAFYGAGRECDPFLCVTYGTGIGGAVVAGRRLYYGAGYSAGEFGHIVTHPGGRKCACGGAGCYEQYASTTALVRAAAECDPACTDGRTLFAKLAAGDAAIRRVVDVWADEVTTGLVTLTHCFNPACILLGGGIMNESYLVGLIREKTRRRIMPSFRNVEIRHTLLGNKAGLFGALFRALQDR